MVRMMRIAFLLGFALSLGMATPQEPPPAPTLQLLATQEADFRACDRDWYHVDDFWSTNVGDLYNKLSETTAVEGSED